MHKRMYMQVYVCMHVYASLACVCICMHACMLMQVCMYVCMHLRPKLLRISPINPTSNVPMHILGCPWEVFCLPDLCSISYYRRFCLRYPTPSLKGDYPKIESWKGVIVPKLCPCGLSSIPNWILRWPDIFSPLSLKIFCLKNCVPNCLVTSSAPMHILGSVLPPWQWLSQNCVLKGNCCP